MVTYVAYACGSVNGLGPADPGVSVYRKVAEDGQLMEEHLIASWVVADVSDEDGNLDAGRAERFLTDSGWRVTGSGWWHAGDGQMGIQVARAVGGLPVTAGLRHR